MNGAARLWRRRSTSSSAAWGRIARSFNCWICVATPGIRSHSSSAASQLWCGSTCRHSSTTGFREKPTDCLDSIRLVTAAVVEAGEAFLVGCSELGINPHERDVAVSNVGTGPRSEPEVLNGGASLDFHGLLFPHFIEVPAVQRAHDAHVAFPGGLVLRAPSRETVDAQIDQFFLFRAPGGRGRGGGGGGADGGPATVH